MAEKKNVFQRLFSSSNNDCCNVEIEEVEAESEEENTKTEKKDNVRRKE